MCLDINFTSSAPYIIIINHTKNESYINIKDGCPNSFLDDDEDEQPAHEVTLSKPYYMSKYPVTQEQYQEMMGTNPSVFKGSKNPVEWVLWDDAQEFCNKLSTQTKQTVGLPTEAQWEYACRAGTQTNFYSGDTEDDLKRVALYEANSSGTTHPVGQKEANAFGLYDLHGNVLQWCQDWKGDYSVNAAVDPQGPARGVCRVVRGGTWGHGPKRCRAAARYSGFPAPPIAINGFRVCVAPTTSGHL